VRSDSQVSVNSQQSATFELPRSARKKLARRAAPIVGTGRSNKIRGAPEPSRDLFVYRVQDGNSSEDIKGYINDNHVDVRDIEQTSKEGSKFLSFKVTIRASDMQKVLQPDFWPCGVCVRRFWRPRTQERS
jgi:hypothetical protein